MKRISVVLLLAVSFCLTSCDWFRHEEKPTDVVLVYMASNNNLVSAAEAELTDIKNGWLPAAGFDSQILLVYLDKGDLPTLKRYSRDDNGNVVEELVTTYPTGTNSATKETLAQVLSDSEKAYPADTRGIVLWSHGTGYLPSSYYSKPTDPVIPDSQISTSSFGYDQDTGKEIELKELRSALEKYHFRFIAFDACLLGGIEVAYEMRNVCDYVLASPTETLTEGFPYETMTEHLFDSETESGMTESAKAFYDYYHGKNSSGTIGVYKTSALPEFKEVCAPLFSKYNDAIKKMDRTKVQVFYRMGRAYFYDFASAMRQVLSDQEYAQFADALNKVVIYKAATPKFLEIEIKEYSGISTYIPRPEYTNLNSYYKTLAWNLATGFVK